MILRCIQHIIKENQLLLKDLLEHWKIKSINCMTSVSKNFYIDKLDDIVDEYNNTYHRTIKMRPVDVKDPNFKVGDHVRISKYKNFFAKGYTPNWSQEVFVIKKVKNAVP